MGIELIYIVGGATLAVLFIIFIAVVKRDTNPIDSTKRVKYNFYLLREQYKNLIQEAKELIVNSEETVQFIPRMKFLNKAQKTVIRGLTFFPDNQEGEALLYKITEKKNVCIEKQITDTRQDLKLRKQKLSSKKFQRYLRRTIFETKKLQKLFPHKTLWNNYLKEIHLSYIHEKLYFFIHEGSRAALRHKYKNAAKMFRLAYNYIQALSPENKKNFNKTELQLKRLIDKIKYRSETIAYKKAA